MLRPFEKLGRAGAHLARIGVTCFQPRVEDLRMIACDGRLAAEVEAEAMRTDLRDLQQHGDALGAILGDGKAHLGAIHLTTAMPLHPLGMSGDVFGAQTTAE